jgi:outer membrane receptor protein involved in Fe transport
MRRFFIITTLLFSIMSFAQNATIKGVVTDAETKEPLIGVNLVVKGTTIGTSTDLEGNFELSVPVGEQTIVFSYVSFVDKNIAINLSEGEVKELNVTLGADEDVNILSTIVVSATKFEQKLGEQTVSIDVMKPVFLERQNLTDISQAVQKNPGVTVIDGQANIRGGSGYSFGAGSRVLLLLDDLPILQADAGFPSWTSIPLENIGQIEIIKGAASALYGSSAMNGIINVRTAYPTSTPLTKISVFGGLWNAPNKNDYSYDINSEKIIKSETDKAWWKQDKLILQKGDLGSAEYDTIDISKSSPWPNEKGFIVGHRQKFGKFDLVAGAMGRFNDDYKYLANSTYGRLSTQLRYRINQNMSVGLNFNFQKSKSESFFLYNGASDLSVPSGYNMFVANVGLTGTPTATKGLKVTIDPYFRYYDEKGNSHKILGRWYKVDNLNTNDQSNFSNFYYGEYQYQRKIAKINFVISTGLVAQYVTVDAPLYGDKTLTSNNLAGYIQLDKKLWNKLNVSAGFRFESNKITDTKRQTKPVGRFGLNYQAAEYTFIRTSFGMGYRFPTIAEKFIQTSLGGSIGIYPNPQLESETGYSLELGIKQGIKLGDFRAFLDAAGFYTEYANMMEFNITTVPTVGFKSNNVGSVRIFGTEVGITGEGKLGKFPFTTLVGYTYIVPRYKEFNDSVGNTGVAKDQKGDSYNILKYRFRHTFTGAWDINFHGIEFGVSMQYFSFMENLDAIFASSFATSRSGIALEQYRLGKRRDNYLDKRMGRQYKGDFIMDARIGYKFGKNDMFKISAIVKNVTNHLYMLRPAVMEAPRNYSLRFDWEMNWKEKSKVDDAKIAPSNQATF